MSQLDDFSHFPTPASPFHAGLSPSTRILRRLLNQVRHGRLNIVLPSGTSVSAQGTVPGPEANIAIKSWRSLRRLLTGGDIGFAQAYIDGDWETPDLTSVIRFAARNRDTLLSTLRGSRWMRLMHRLGHLLNANTKRGSRKTSKRITIWAMTFIVAGWILRCFIHRRSGTKRRPHLKLHRNISCSALEKSWHLRAAKNSGNRLWLGCPCGYLAEHGDACVTGITLSPSQLAWANAGLVETGQSDAVDLRLQDYRDVEGQFDRIVSIEMFEAVGEAYWPDYFAMLKRCLKADGRVVLQIISIEDARFEDYRRKADFIQKFIFPGGFLPSDKVLEQHLAKAGLVLKEVEHFGHSYAQTLAEWRRRFVSNWSEIEKLGFDHRFRRLWEYYLCYCEGGFKEGAINVGLYTIEHE